MWFEMTAGNKQLVTLKNPQKCCYTSIYWDTLEQELYAADEKGYVYIINVYQEDKIIIKKHCEEKIKRIEIIEEGLEKKVDFEETKQDDFSQQERA